MAREKSILRNVDWWTILIYLILVFLGWINIYAATYDESHSSIFDVTQRYGKQLRWIIPSIVLGIGILLIDSRIYYVFSYPIYAFVLLLLVAVLIFGREVHGARSWFELGSFRLQPAEFGKFATCLALARFMNNYNQKIHNLQNLLNIGVIIFIPLALIVLQNDTGSALVYFIFSLVLFREGLTGNILLLGLMTGILFVCSLIFSQATIFLLLAFSSLAIYGILERNYPQVFRALLYCIGLFALVGGINEYFALKVSFHIVLLIIFAFASLYFLYQGIKRNIRNIYFIVALFWASIAFNMSVDYFFHEVLGSHQRTRINVLLGIEEDLRGAGYNVHQSKIAIGSGGFSGKGFLQGTQTKFQFVPEQSTDFIFCTVGEEWGFLGTTTVIVLFIILLIRLLQIAERQRAIFARVYGYGVACILFFHVAINVGMTIGLAPVIGIPLPFFSYGGSSLLAFTLLLFVFLRLDLNRTELF